MKDLGNMGRITFSTESVERGGKDLFSKPIKVKWEGFLASSFKEISAASIWLPLLINPLLFDKNIIPEKYKNLFTRVGDPKSQHVAFAEYFEEFIQSISFFNYFRSQIDHKTREPEKDLNKKHTIAFFHWLETGVGFCITYAMGRNKKNLLEITQEYITFLKGSGTQGAKLAKAMQKLSQEEEDALWGTWEAETPPMWLSLLYRIFLEDRFEKQKRRAEMPPAITRKNLTKGLTPFLKEKTPLIEVKEDRIEYFQPGTKSTLGFIPTNMKDIPNIHSSTIPIVKAGGEIFNSFMAHKLIRYESKLIYERSQDTRIRLKENYARVEIAGGYAELARQLGFQKNGKTLDALKKIMHFQAGFRFIIPTSDGGSWHGNLILLEEKKNRFGEIGELVITAGSMLAPDAVYTTSPADGDNLLIPFIELPEEMVGRKLTWGSQALYHLLLAKHLTDKSREFAKKGSITILDKEFQKLGEEANLPREIASRLSDVQDLFCCPEQGFLEKQGNEYALNKKHERVQKHLIKQGVIRETWAKRANIGQKKKKVKRPK